MEEIYYNQTLVGLERETDVFNISGRQSSDNTLRPSKITVMNHHYLPNTSMPGTVQSALMLIISFHPLNSTITSVLLLSYFIDEETEVPKLVNH